jgi:hypothetical protein
LIFEHFLKICQGLSHFISLKSVFIWKPIYVYDHISFLLTMKSVSGRSCREN